MDRYFHRKLRTINDLGEICYVNDADLFKNERSRIILGEPGMGKSELIRHLGSMLATSVISATRFVSSKVPTSFLEPGKPLLIDGLDEAMARRHGDAIDQVLAQLEVLGCPPFVLSCRSREWQSRTIAKFHECYGDDPEIFTIEPLLRAEALLFFEDQFPSVNAERVLKHLDRHRLEDLYRNPLTLGLMGKVAEKDHQLPETRAALLERVCELIWPEHDPNREDLDLGQISKEQALDSAGAIFASLLFSGAEAVTNAGPPFAVTGDLSLVEVGALPGADKAAAIYDSKLFNSIGPNRATPIHRVIAEFLGARWLARHTKTPRSHRRLLAQLQPTGEVPASLRGLHAWLAHHSSEMAERVISADSFGVLRYGEVGALPVSMAGYLLEALISLADDDPYFRKQDWDKHSASALFIPTFRERIEKIIASSTSNEHLRLLLIESLEGSQLAVPLGATLEAILRCPRRFFAERLASVDALFHHRNRSWWRGTIAELRDQGTPDSTRLARNIIQMLKCDVSDELLVSTLFAELGVIVNPLPRSPRRKILEIRAYGRITKTLSAQRLISVLNLLTDYASLIDRNDWESRTDVVKLICELLVRAIEEKVVGSNHAAEIWRWLEILEYEHISNDGFGKVLMKLFQNDNALRQQIQHYVFFEQPSRDTVWRASVSLQNRFVGLYEHPEDIVRHLNFLANANASDPVSREAWQDLMRLGTGPDGINVAVRSAGESFLRGDTQMEDFVQRLENPRKPYWQVKQDRRAAKEERKRKIGFEENRRFYSRNRHSLRAGELKTILRPSRAYLGLFNDLTGETGIGRLEEWLGEDLIEDVLLGLEAVLFRGDLPAPAQVAQGFADNVTWNFCFAIVAGLLERKRNGRSLDDLPDGVCAVGFLLCLDQTLLSGSAHFDVLQEDLEKRVIQSDSHRKDFARVLIEPVLRNQNSHATGLYQLNRDQRWIGALSQLSAEWLKTDIDLPDEIETELVDCLIRSGANEKLANIGAERRKTTFRNFDRLLFWLAIDVLVRFDATHWEVIGIGTRQGNLLWYLRDRIRAGWQGEIVPVNVNQAKWIISEFRTSWPNASITEDGRGEYSPYEATTFLSALMSRLAGDTSSEAIDALMALIAEPEDSYTNLLRHLAAEQRQKRAEMAFNPLDPAGLRDLLDDGPPTNIEDIRTLVLEELNIGQQKLFGSDTDTVKVFWNPVTGFPHDENFCRDRLVDLVGPELARYGVLRITESDMPNDKRVDIGFHHGRLQLPMEVKGQWHKAVWDAASHQLDQKYLIDWRSEQRGIFCVLWFGDLPSKSGFRLKAHPDDAPAPKMPEEMGQMIKARLPENRKSTIDVVVVDLSGGKPQLPKKTKKTGRKISCASNSSPAAGGAAEDAKAGAVRVVQMNPAIRLGQRDPKFELLIIGQQRAGHHGGLVRPFAFHDHAGRGAHLGVGRDRQKVPARLGDFGDVGGGVHFGKDHEIDRVAGIERQVEGLEHPRETVSQLGLGLAG